MERKQDIILLINTSNSLSPKSTKKQPSGSKSSEQDDSPETQNNQGRDTKEIKKENLIIHTKKIEEIKIAFEGLKSKNQNV